MANIVTVEKPGKYQTIEDYTGIKWCVKARSKEESRYCLNLISSTGKRIVATDGHRLHTYKMQITAIPKGLYKVIEAKGQIILSEYEGDATYPEWLQVVPKHKRAITIDIEGNPKKDHLPAIAKVLRAIPDNMAVNLQYLSDLLEDSKWRVNTNKDATDPFLFRNGRKTGIIMPLFLNERR